MRAGVKADILTVLHEAVAILREPTAPRVLELEALSNRIIHSATITQHEDVISVTIILYALYKVMQRAALSSELVTAACTQLEAAAAALEADRTADYRSALRSLFDLISKTDVRVTIYVQELLEKARIKKGTKIYEHGPSIAKVAELLGLSRWELMPYIGATELFEVIKARAPAISARLAFAASLFGL